MRRPREMRAAAGIPAGNAARYSVLLQRRMSSAISYPVW